MTKQRFRPQTLEKISVKISIYYSRTKILFLAVNFSFATEDTEITEFFILLDINFELFSPQRLFIFLRYKNPIFSTG